MKAYTNCGLPTERWTPITSSMLLVDVWMFYIWIVQDIHCEHLWRAQERGEWISVILPTASSWHWLNISESRINIKCWSCWNCFVPLSKTFSDQNSSWLIEFVVFQSDWIRISLQSSQRFLPILIFVARSSCEELSYFCALVKLALSHVVIHQLSRWGPVGYKSDLYNHLPSRFTDDLYPLYCKNETHFNCHL